MRDPFKIDGRTAISVSGGRTSAYMLWRVLQANTAEDLQRWLVITFANTGLEHDETLVFVRECAVRWGVTVNWVEYRNDEAGFALVDFDSASRNGEPFEAIIKKRQYLPNPVTRFCTSELKIRAMHKYLRSLGWHESDDGWDQFIGIRADEPSRVSRIRARGHSTESRKETMCMPLADAGVSVRDVDAFWHAQPFNLNLPTYGGRTLAGNCVLCFLKPRTQVASLISEVPQRAVWWARQETETAQAFDSLKGPQPVYVWKYDADLDDEVKVPLLAADGVTPVMRPPDKAGANFRSDRPSYSAMLQTALTQGDLFPHDPDEEAIACFCGD